MYVAPSFYSTSGTQKHLLWGIRLAWPRPTGKAGLHSTVTLSRPGGVCAGLNRVPLDSCIEAPDPQNMIYLEIRPLKSYTHS